MSSTNRGSSRDFHISDYYVTPPKAIRDFWVKFIRIDDEIDLDDIKILDCCAGGLEKDGVLIEQMSYPLVLKESGLDCDTIDIREDSAAQIKGNYLELDCKNKYDLIITNPPFNYAQEIISKAIDDVQERGYVIMLLRLNFWESKKRRSFFAANMPYYSFIHSERMSFTSDGKTDSVAYMHLVWIKGQKPDYCQTYLI